MTYGLDYKACKGCGDEKGICAFIRGIDEEDYCRDCRQACKFCGDWVGICGGKCGESEELAALAMVLLAKWSDEIERETA